MILTYVSFVNNPIHQISIYYIWGFFVLSNLFDIRLQKQLKTLFPLFKRYAFDYCTYLNVSTHCVW